jgi:hypothetical protein
MVGTTSRRTCATDVVSSMAAFSVFSALRMSCRWAGYSACESCISDSSNGSQASRQVFAWSKLISLFISRQLSLLREQLRDTVLRDGWVPPVSPAPFPVIDYMFPCRTALVSPWPTRSVCRRPSSGSAGNRPVNRGVRGRTAAVRQLRRTAAVCQEGVPRADELLLKMSQIEY